MSASTAGACARVVHAGRGCWSTRVHAGGLLVPAVQRAPPRSPEALAARRGPTCASRGGAGAGAGRVRACAALSCAARGPARPARTTAPPAARSAHCSPRPHGPRGPAPPPGLGPPALGRGGIPPGSDWSALGWRVGLLFSALGAGDSPPPQTGQDWGLPCSAAGSWPQPGVPSALAAFRRGPTLAPAMSDSTSGCQLYGV